MSPRIPAVGVVGAGAVGQAVGAALVSARLCDQLLLASSSVDQAAALADDLNDMCAGIGSPVRAHAVEVAELRSCPAVVVAVRARFTNTRSTDVRMGGMHANAPALLALAEEFRGYPGTLLVVTNPVDLMTRLVAEASGCARVFGLGSSLDTARYRLTLARLLDVPLDAVRGHVIGEHGDAAVVCASTTTVNGTPARVPLEQVRSELRERPGRISAGIGRTRFGPAGALVSALRLVLGVEDGVTELSALYDDVCLGIPLRFSGGRPLPCVPPLDEAEARQWEAARSKLRAAYRGVRGVPSQPLSSGRNS
ncbi:lactate/malate family dehydrogenase [Streptomyces nogalater]|uniref:Lactate dehydrogenase n=1 Tax=Streptomyces nogalater TaxID=38314 RepID=A0ABW0WLI3_STRNO